MNIVIIGAGSTARTVFEIIQSNRDYSVMGFIGNTAEFNNFKKEVSQNTLNYQILGDRSSLAEISSLGISSFIVAIGNKHIRETFYYEAISLGLKPITAISKEAIIDKSAQIGSGTIVKPGSIISNNVRIGENCIIDSGVIIENGTTILNNCNIKSGAVLCSNSKISKNVEVGIRAVITNEVHVGKNQLIEPNQILNENLPDLYRPKKNEK